MLRVVISQPMYFPWVGLLEQLSLADVYVHYDDVQFVKGFFNRVQIKTPNGIRWLTIPLRDQHRGQNIDEVQIDNQQDWRSQHISSLKNAYSRAPYFKDMLTLVDDVFSVKTQLLSDVAKRSTLALANYFSIGQQCTFWHSSELNIKGKSSKRLLDICIASVATEYVTGHGAADYLEHAIFEAARIKVEYMRYQKRVYPQLFGDFTPFVSGLDLVANCGHLGIGVICSGTMPWQEFLAIRGQ